MASINARLETGGAFVKLPMYSSTDANHIPYSDSTDYITGTIGKKVKDLSTASSAQSEKIENLNKLGLYIDSNGNIIDIWED